MNRPLTLATLLTLGGTMPGSGAAAFGPGVHNREAFAVLMALAESDPEYAALLESPLARSWLTLGSVAPDFMFMADALGFGHEPGLSAHLMADALGRSPEYRLFALGHQCHVASDGSSEAFVVPALFSAAAVGPTDLFADQVAYKEAEGVVESLGDLLTGDWHAVVDTFYDLWIPPADRGGFEAVFAWYCEAGSAYLGRPVDCVAARAELGDGLAKLEEVFSLFDRAGAHDFVDHLTTLPIPELMDFALSLAGGDAFGGLLGAELGAALTPWVDREVAWLNTTAFVTPAFWARYQGLAELGPSFALDRIRDGSSGWPSYDLFAIESGLVTSALQAVALEDLREPAGGEGGAPVYPGVFIDELVFRGPDGAVLSELDEQHAGQTITAQVRFFSAWPLTGTVIAKVRADNASLRFDPVVTERRVEVDIDPRRYAVVARETVTVSFIADLEGTLGYGVELWVDLGDGGGERLAIATGRDRLWLAPSLGRSRPAFAELLGLSPRSLPVAGAWSEDGLALVEIEAGLPSSSPAPGRPVGGALVRVGGVVATSSEFGDAVFTPRAGTHPLLVRATGFHDHSGSLTVSPVRSSADIDHIARHKVLIEPVVDLVLGDGRFSASRTTLSVAVAGAALGLATGFEVKVAGVPARGQATLGPGGVGEIALLVPVADGTRLSVTGQAVYPGGLGRPSTASVVVDASPPTLAMDVAIHGGPGACAPEAGPWRPPYEVLVVVGEPHSGPVALSASRGGSPFEEVELGESGEASVVVEAGAEALTLTVRAVNQAGLETVAPVELGLVEAPVCAEPGPESAESGSDTEKAPESAESEPRASSGGCGAGPWLDPGWVWLLGLAGLRLGSGRRAARGRPRR